MLDDLYCHKNTHNSVVFFSLYFILSHDLKTTRWQGRRRASCAASVSDHPNPTRSFVVAFFIFFFHFHQLFYPPPLPPPPRAAIWEREATICHCTKKGNSICTSTYLLYFFFFPFRRWCMWIIVNVYVMHSFVHSFYVVLLHYVMEVFASSISVWQRHFVAYCGYWFTLKPVLKSVLWGDCGMEDSYIIDYIVLEILIRMVMEDYCLLRCCLSEINSAINYFIYVLNTYYNNKNYICGAENEGRK